MAQSPSLQTRQRVRMDTGWRFHVASNPVLLNTIQIKHWRMKIGGTGEADAAALAAPGLDTGGAGWVDAQSGQDVFHGPAGFAWYRAALPDVPGPHRLLRVGSVDDNGTVYLNGKRLARHNGFRGSFDVLLDAAWRPGGPNVLAILDENVSGGGGIMGDVTLGTFDQVLESDTYRPDFNDKSWRIVTLPHDFVVEGAFTPDANAAHGSLPLPTAWYRKTFTLPLGDKGKSVWIDFDGVYRDSVVYLNGQKLGEHPGGYTGFRYDIRKAAHFGGPNVLAVFVDPRQSEGWWYEGGGIYRHVWLNVADPLHVAPWGTFVASNVIDPLGKPAAALTIKTTLTNQGATGAACTLVSRVLGPDGAVVASATTPQIVPAGGSVEVRQRAAVHQARLWSPESPSLYHLRTTVLRGGKPVDTDDTPFGIRVLRFDTNRGLFLNGKHVEIKGTCNHQDFSGVGIAMPDSLQAWRVRKLLALGSNAYRMSHNPPAPELLDACDRLGMLVMDENRHLGDTFDAKSSPGTPSDDMSELNAMILRDRNHPSIFAWSLCNEEENLQATDEGARTFAAMKADVNRYDGTRPVTGAMNGFFGWGISHVADLEGFNYNPGQYAGYHKDHPQQPILGTEISIAVSTRGVYANDGDRGWSESYDTRLGGSWSQTAEAAWEPIATQAFVAGGFVWTGFDYKGEPSPYGWPCINSGFGLFDVCGFPKDVAYYYRSVWSDKPMVHLLPHWNWPGKEGQPVRVWAYSNAYRVELSLNGNSLGARDVPPAGHAEWNVPYAPGMLKATATRNGQVVATDAVQTTGVPSALKLTVEPRTLIGDGEDAAVVAVSVVDSLGRVVPTADNLVTFSVTGPVHVAGVGNGDPSSHEPDRATQRHAFNGLCAAIVQAGQTPGTATVTATAVGLSSAVILLRVVPSIQK